MGAGARAMSILAGRMWSIRDESLVRGGDLLFLLHKSVVEFVCISGSYEQRI